MPRLRKNPFMSLWLSAANRLAGTGRGLLTAAFKRQQRATATEAAKTTQDFWRATSGTSTQRRRKGE